MRIEIAGLVVDLQFDDPSREAWARRRYPAFRTSRPADVALEVNLFDRLPGVPRVLRGERVDTRIGVLGRGIAADLDLRNRTGVVGLLRSRFGINALLRVVVAVVLLEENGLLLHAAGVRVGQGAWVFPGRSGAGKSTLSKRFPRADVLSDEVVAVRLRRGRVEACGTPFPGELNGKGRPGWLPLLGFGFLRGPRRPRLVPLGAADALRRLLACTLGGWAGDSDVLRLWKAASRLIKAARCADFGFSPSEPRRSLVARLCAWRRPPSRGRGRSPRRPGVR